MEASHQEKAPSVCLPSEDNDAKYVSGLSTILVASIQEVKDRISQIEYIFCSKLYPNVQKNSKCIQMLYSEARKAAQDEWKDRISELELQLKQLSAEKEQACVDSKVFEAEKLELAGRIADLEQKLLQKAKEVDDGMDLHAKIIDLNESKTSIIMSKEKQMKKHEERVDLLMSKLKGLEGNIITLNKELQEKNEELLKGNELKEELFRQMEAQALKITNSEHMLADTVNEKKHLAMQLGDMGANFDHIKDELRRKTIEVEEGNKIREQLVQQVKLNGIESTKKDRQLSAYEREKNLLLSRINDLDKEVGVLQENLKNGICGINETCQHCNDLAQQLERKNSELAAEKKRSRDLLAAYKRLKSQYNFLLSKCGLSNEELHRQMKVEGESDLPNQDSKSLNPPELKKRNPASNMVASDLNKVKKELDPMKRSDCEKGEKLNNARSTHTPSSNAATETRWTTKGNMGSSSGTKRPAPGWRDTRSRQSPGGPDPHDDFLDTPYENMRENLCKSVNDKIKDIPAQVSKDTDSNSSDDETQDMEAELGSKRPQLQALKPGPKGFKYVEPVRKKSERQNLNGVECNQCKTFYDAVLSDAEGRDGENGKQNFRCEHHDGVSRHRYRYVPPMTPEGFWNIGFDTET